MEKVLQLLNSISPLSPALESHLQHILKRNSFQKDSYLLQAGQVSNCIHYIELGLVRGFYYNGAQEINIWFMQAGNVVISAVSFMRQVKSSQYIQAVEDCITWSITYQQLQDIYKRYPEFNLHRATLIEKCFVASKKWQRMLSLNSA
ncbi:Crp/Fnr family transcriptional regulator [Ilyomonas limi]|nr:cyclic nucleotide-binding domain-containing protein [Ilyomonas limi]